MLVTVKKLVYLESAQYNKILSPFIRLNKKKTKLKKVLDSQPCPKRSSYKTYELYVPLQS